MCIRDSLNDYLAGCLIDTDLVHALSLEFQLDARLAERDVYKRQHGNHVNAWILSHPHQDHAGAFNQIYASPDGITIDAVYDLSLIHI